MTDIIIKTVVANDADLNRDPLSGTPGAHPLGTGAGAASGGAAGAVAGLALGGPVGSLIGVAVGAVVGAIAGKSAAEAVNPTDEETYWRETYIREPYYVGGKAYEYYAPGFRAGWEGRVRHGALSFADAEPALKAEYMMGKGELDPDWNDMRPAAHAAWVRVEGKRA